MTTTAIGHVRIRGMTGALLATAASILLLGGQALAQTATPAPTATPKPCTIGAVCQSSSGPLSDLWSKLNTARAYRCLSVGSNGKCEKNSYDQMIAAYQASSDGLGGKSPQAIFFELATACSLGGRSSETKSCTKPATGFGTYVGDPAYSTEAKLGLQEAINELIVGQLLIGNEYLLKGLRTRFPNTGDPADPDQLTLLKASVQSLQDAIDAIIDEVRLRPENLRASGSVSAQFRFWVENTRRKVAASGQYEGNGSTVESELYQYTGLVGKAGEAANSVAKRIYYFENDKTDGRATARSAAKRSAQIVYLNNAVLNAIQSEADFKNNDGYKLKRLVSDSQQLFDDINAGFNPLKLQGDFVPYQGVESLMSGFSSLVSDAVAKEDSAIQIARQVDTDKTALANELLNQQSGALSQISALSGLSLDELAAYQLTEITERQRLLSKAEANSIAGEGRLGLARQAIAQAEIDRKFALEEVRAIPEKIRIEQETTGEVARLSRQGADQVTVLTVAEKLAIAAATGASPLGESPVKYIVEAAFEGAKKTAKLENEIQISSVRSAAVIKTLLLQQVTALLGVIRADSIIKTRKAEYEEAWADFNRLLTNYNDAQSNLVEAYFSNPAYRLQKTIARENADKSFEAAMVQGFYAAKALEYEWAEEIENPVRKLDGTLSEPIGDTTTYNGITSAESVFGSRSAGAGGAPSPSLITFRQALQLWDSKMRQFRFPAQQSGNTVRLSLRKDILGYGDRPEAESRSLFKTFIKQKRVAGGNPQNRDLILEFNLPIASQRYFPAVPNLKIESIRASLKSSPGRSLRTATSSGNAAMVNLVMLDTAQVRTFFANYPTDDDVLVVDLQEGRNLFDSPFFAQIEAPVDGYPAVAGANTQLQGHSPAVTRWTLWLDMENGENRNLDLEYLDDIEIEVAYRFGRPRPFNF